MKHNQPQNITIKKISKELIGTLLFQAISKQQQKSSQMKYNLTNPFSSKIIYLTNRYNKLVNKRNKRYELIQIYNLIKSLENINDPYIFANTIILINNQLSKIDRVN